MTKWAPLGVIICLCCSSLLVSGGCAVGNIPAVGQQSIRETQGGTPTFVYAWPNTTETYAFTSGKVTLVVVSDGSGVLLVNITNTEGAITPVINATVAFTAPMQICDAWFTPEWETVPGNYSLQVAAWYINGTTLQLVWSGTVTVQFGLALRVGIPLLLAVFAIAIIMVIKLRKPASKEKVEPEKITSTAEGSAVSSGVPNKIHCPECKKLIDEGSVFCAECGARVPEFLRYNASQA